MRLPSGVPDDEYPIRKPMPNAWIDRAGGEPRADEAGACQRLTCGHAGRTNVKEHRLSSMCAWVALSAIFERVTADTAGKADPATVCVHHAAISAGEH